MGVYASTWDNSNQDTNPSALVFRQTHWGIAVTDGLGPQNVALLEFLAKSLALLLPLAGTTTVIMGQSLSSEPPLLRLAMILLFAMVGLGLYSYSARGFVREVQIDESRQQIRTGSRTASGRKFSERTYPINDIASVFIRRSKNKKTLVTLNLRLKSDPHNVRLLRGPESALVPVLEYIVATHRKSKQAGGRPRTRTTGRFIHADFSR